MNGYYKHCSTIRSPCMSYGTVPKSRGENRVPADEQFCRWHTLTAISPPKVFSLPQLQGQPHLASSMLLTSPKERAERNTLAPFKGPYRIQHGVFRIARGIGPTAGRVARRPQADPTRGRAGTEGDAEYTIDNNPWRCDCDIMVPFWLKKNGLRPFENQIVCSRPAKFSGQKLNNIRPENLLCKVPTTSTVNDQTESANNVHNGITCTHRTTSYHSISKQNTATTARPIDTTLTTLSVNSGKPEVNSSQNSLLESAGNAHNSITYMYHTPRYQSISKQNTGTTAHPIDTTFTTLPDSPGKPEGNISQIGQLESGKNAYTSTASQAPRYHWYFNRNAGPTPRRSGTTFTTQSANATTPENNTCHVSAPTVPPLVDTASVCGLIASAVLIATIILAIWYKKRVRNLRSDNKTKDVLNNRSLQAKTQSNNAYEDIDTATNNLHQTDQSKRQGQSRAITESNANTTATLTVVTDVHHHQDKDINQHYQTGQGQSQTTTDHDGLLSNGTSGNSACSKTIESQLKLPLSAKGRTTPGDSEEFGSACPKCYVRYQSLRG
ncbi:hypothetical protein Bbelb_378150 [Branchiostoma belcheri]|nr:hypothetical protein Bbelb_378150 [Branchiostoma belcheri]